MKKISLTQLKKHLRQKTQNELVEEIAHLYKSFSQVKEYYQASFLMTMLEYWKNTSKS